jgi:hypothetical protein
LNQGEEERGNWGEYRGGSFKEEKKLSLAGYRGFGVHTL